MSTGSTWLVLQPTSILALDDLTTDFRDQLLDELGQLRADIFGDDGTLGGTKASFTYSAPTISLAADAVGFTGEGDRIEADSAAAEWLSVPFTNTGGVTYQIGARVNRYPTAVTANTVDGQPVYSQEVEAVGELGAPSAVVDTGTGLRFTVTALAGAVWSGAETRPVKVWKVTPATAVLADAVVDGTAEADGSGGIRVTITGYLGQDTPSLTAADYQVLILGPTVKTSGISTDAAYWFMGSITSGVFTNAAATAFIPWGSWLSVFGIEHDTGSGVHTNATALSYSYRAGPGRNGVYQVEAYELGAHLFGFRQAGGTVQQGKFVAPDASNPAHVRTVTAVSGTYAELLIPTRWPPDQAIIVNDLSAAIWLLTAGASEQFTIELVERAAGGASGTIVALATWTMGKPAASTWGTVVPTAGPAFPYTIPAPATAGAVRYWRIRFYEPNPGNVRFAGLWGGAAAAKVSPIPH